MIVFEPQSRLEEFMLYGLYPGIFHLGSAFEKEKFLNELSSSYLYKDVFEPSFIIFRPGGFSRNLRKEISKRAKIYFWRTYTVADVDYVEERQGQFYAYEIKLHKEIKKAPQSWVENYGDNFRCISRNNFYEFVMS